MNEIARNKAGDKLTQRSFNNREGSHMGTKEEVKELNKLKDKTKKK